MPTFIAEYVAGRNWKAGSLLRDQPLQAHVEYLLGLHVDKRLLMGGPLSDGSGGLVIFSADCYNDVEELVSNDPAATAGILEATLKEWSRIV